MMIRSFVITALMIISFNVFCQPDYSVTDKKSLTVPDTIKTYMGIAKYLTSKLNTDREKARAIYYWISHNIKYDIKLLNSGVRYDSTAVLLKEVMNNRQGVCQHYSELFSAMCNSVGIKTYVVTGYARQGDGKIGDISHAWNAVKSDTGFYLIDVTWASGYMINDKYIHDFRDDYFMTEPGEFIKTHIPFDPIWQFLDNPVNNNDFISQDFSKLSKKGVFNFRDSISCYEKQKKLQQFESANKRIVNSGINNRLIQKQYNENYLQITCLKYNLAADTLNFGINNYNMYILHKNKRFRKPKMQDENIQRLLDNAGKGIYCANKILYELFTNDKQLSDLINESKTRMPLLISDLEKEKEFVSRYVKMWKPLRIFMFYKEIY